MIVDIKMAKLFMLENLLKNFRQRYIDKYEINRTDKPSLNIILIDILSKFWYATFTDSSSKQNKLKWIDSIQNT